MDISASPSLHIYHDSSAAGTTLPYFHPPIDWSFLFRSQEEQLRLDAEKELERIKSNKIHINERRKDLFR